MEYLGWTLTRPTITNRGKDSRVYAMNKNGDSFIAESIDAAMRGVIIRETLVSNCCGAREQSTSEDGGALFDRYTNICSDCRELCHFVPEVEFY